MAYFAPYIDGSGLHLPTYAERLDDLLSAYRTVFGQEAELSEAVPDYQLLSVFAKALDDLSALVLQAYHSRNPATASGNALDLLLPQYGITRNPGESDASARARMRLALAARGTGTPDALLAAVRAAQNVKDARVHVNGTSSTDADGVPANSIAVVVHGGNAAQVARAIFEKKAPGVATYGSTSKSVTDRWGMAHTVRFSRASETIVDLYLTIKKLSGCDEAAVRAAVEPALLAWANGLPIAEGLNVPQAYALCYTAAPELASTFVVTDVQAAVLGESATTRELVPCAWNGKIAVLEDGGVHITFRE